MGIREENSKEVFLEYIDRAIKTNLTELVVTHKPGAKSFPIYTHPQFRLIMVLEGKYAYTIYSEKGFEEVELLPGKVLFSQRGGATGRTANTVNMQMLTLVFWPGLVRFLISYGDGHMEKNEHLWYHSHSSINHFGTFLLKALDVYSDTLNIQACPLVKVLLQLCREHLLADDPQNITKSFRTYQNIMVYLYENFGEDINRENVAWNFSISPSHISKLFAKYNENNFNTILKTLRLEYAEELLRSTTFLISEIAEQCGFNDTDYFIKTFRLFYGETPGNFRRKATTE